MLKPATDSRRQEHSVVVGDFRDAPRPRTRPPNRGRSYLAANIVRVHPLLHRSNKRTRASGHRRQGPQSIPCRSRPLTDDTDTCAFPGLMAGQGRVRVRRNAPPRTLHHRVAAERSLCSLLQQGVDEDLSIKRSKIIRAFAEAHQLDRYAELPLHLNHDAALG
jgi:hypothetical protein